VSLSAKLANRKALAVQHFHQTICKHFTSIEAYALSLFGISPASYIAKLNLKNFNEELNYVEGIGNRLGNNKLLYGCYGGWRADGGAE
jgi:hypothetical protein